MSDQTIESRKKGILKYVENPFVENLCVPVKKKYSSIERGLFVIQETGEGIETAAISKIQDVDQEQFVKIFAGGVGAFFSLKPSTQKVLEVLLVELQKRKDKDIIYLDYRLACDYFTKKGNDENGNKKKLTISRPTFHRCLKELIEAEFIAESTYSNQYYINPFRFYNGDRLKLIKEYRIKSTTKLESDVRNQHENS